MGCGSTNELVEIQRSNVESAEWAGLESDRMSESSHSLRANKSLQSQYTQENPKVINGLNNFKDAFQHIRMCISWLDCQEIEFSRRHGWLAQSLLVCTPLKNCVLTFV